MIEGDVFFFFFCALASAGVLGLLQGKTHREREREKGAPQISCCSFCSLSIDHAWPVHACMHACISRGASLEALVA